MISEFDIIRRYFTRPAPSADLGVGDDCALLSISPGQQLAVSTDMLVSGRHFFADTDPARLGRKALAVNLSDMAAMGATPRWFTLSLALPEADEAWIAEFSRGLFGIAREFNVELIGGDTTAGPLNICVQIMGEVPRGKALMRSGARVGDDIWVSGTLGDAALALLALQGTVPLKDEALSRLRGRLESPTPRLALGIALRDIAHAAIDVSDGLLADLGHVLEHSAVGASIEWERLPVSPTVRAMGEGSIRRHCVLSGGDDYELCFTAPTTARENIEALSRPLNLPLSRIGSIVASGLNVYDGRGTPIEIDRHGYDHFL